MVLEWLRKSPLAFKILVASAMIENIAFGLIIPYLTIYMVETLKISETLSGIELAAYTVTGIPAIILGGMMADKIGRRVVLLASLSLMSVTMLLYFFANGFLTLLLVVLADSFVGSLYMPAANAMVADVIKPVDRPKAYSTLRIAWNSGLVVGPAIGVFIVAAYSIRELFVFGSVILVFAFVLNLALIPETRPKSAADQEVTLRSVLAVSKNRPFLVLVTMTGVLWFFLSQWISVLQLYSVQDLNMDTSVPGILFVVNALMIVGFQLWVTSKMVKFRRSIVLMSGQLICAAGFSLVFFANDIYTLIACVVVATIGEIIYMSIVAAIIADMSPEAERGVYMGFSGFMQSLAMGLGLFFGMWLLDVLPVHKYIWLIFGAIGFFTSWGYLVFARMIGPQKDHPGKYVEDLPIKTIPIEKA
jgi:MFS family permease